MTRASAYTFVQQLTTSQRNMLRVFIGNDAGQRNLKAALGMPCKKASVSVLPAPKLDYVPAQEAVGQ